MYTALNTGVEASDRVSFCFRLVPYHEPPLGKVIDDLIWPRIEKNNSVRNCLEAPTLWFLSWNRRCTFESLGRVRGASCSVGSGRRGGRSFRVRVFRS